MLSIGEEGMMVYQQFGLGLYNNYKIIIIIIIMKMLAEHTSFWS